MSRRPQEAPRRDLEQFSDVDDEGALERRRVDPLVCARLDLQACLIRFDEQQCQNA